MLCEDTLPPVGGGREVQVGWATAEGGLGAELGGKGRSGGGLWLSDWEGGSDCWGAEKCMAADGAEPSEAPPVTGPGLGSEEGFSLVGVAVGSVGLETGRWWSWEGGAMGAGGEEGDEEEGSGAELAWAEAAAVLLVGVFGSEKSCFLVEEGVWRGSEVGGLEVGVVFEEVTEEGVLACEAESEEALPAGPCEARGFESPPGLPLCLGEPLALPGLTGRTGNGPQVLGGAAVKVPPN